MIADYAFKSERKLMGLTSLIVRLSMFSEVYSKLNQKYSKMKLNLGTVCCTGTSTLTCLFLSLSYSIGFYDWTVVEQTVP